MGKKRYNNYDNTVFGQYIKAIENPDSVGWDPIKRIWVAPKGKKFDSRNRGMGIDILNNIKARELTKNRPGQYLTEKEENQLRNEHIQYLLDVIDKRKEKNPALQNMSPKKQAQVLGILYRGDASKLWDKNSTLGKALQSDGDADMDRAIQQYYSSINLGERARNDAAFWNKRQPHAVKPLVDYSIKTDALRVNNPYQTQIESTIIVPQMVPDGYVEAHKLTPSEDRINKFQESMEAYKRFNTLMDAISLPNNPAPQYNPKAPYVISTHADGGFLQPQDAWDALSMREKAEMMKVAVKHGIYNLQDIRTKYNEFAEGGDTDWSYNSWKRQIAEYMDIRPDEDKTYDYEAYFRKYPEEAWRMLKGDPDAHFSDEFKTVYHPTFSSKSIGNDGSIYSGVRNSKTNPQGLVGGTWSPDYHTFTMSIDGYRGPVSMDDRKWYLENAEDNGVVLREADGSLPVYDDMPWGGVLPNIIINGSRRGKKFEDGGFTSELDWSPDSWFSKRVAKPDGTLYNDEEAARLASHVPEYNNIEQTAKANGTWLKMSDGSIWKGDPRSWVMMQSESYKKNYSPKPWYTGQAEWPTTFDYGKGKVDTNKVTRAPYYNNQMWFSDSKDYGQTFADYQNSTGLGWRFDTPGEEDVKGHNFLSAIPKEGNYRTLESSANGRPDQWQRLPFVLEDGTINRLPESQISVDSKGRNIRADKQKVLTDDVVNWSKDLGDQGIFMQNIDDGAIIKNGEILRQPVNEFISQPGFTDKVKFIEGNTGDFDIDNPYKYANNFYVKDSSLDNNYAALGGPLVEAAMNEYKNGGGIHIKPSHRGRLTELKKRTGKTEAELYNDGNPAHKKMVVFARNSRKWHGDGGNLFSGEEEGSQQMNIFRRPNGEYFYQASPDSEEVTVTPLNTMFNNPALWTYVDADGKVYSPRQTPSSIQGTVIRKEDKGPLVEAAKNYLGELQYDINNGVPIGGKYTLPAIVAAAALPVVGEAAAPILANPYVDAGLTSAFAAHGLNHAINEGINGWGDAAMTALEIAPLGRLAKPMWNIGKEAMAEIQSLYNNYPIRNYNIDAILKSDFYNKISEQFGKEIADDLAQRLTSKEFRDYLFGDNPRKVFKDADRHLEQMQFIKDVENAGGLLGGSGQLARVGTVNREGLMHDLDFFVPGSMENKTSSVVDALGLNKHSEPLVTLFGPTGTKPKVFNNTMGSMEKGYINLPQEHGNVEADMFIRDHMPTEDEAVNIILDAKRQFGRPKDIADIEAFKYYSADNPIIDINTGRGQWNPTLFDEGLFTGERYPFVQSVETYPGSGVRVPAVMNYKGEIRSLVSRPQTANTTAQITAENATNITPEQWTAAQDAAIARGDMAEAQRLRDLHFKISASNTKVVDVAGNPQLVIHKTPNDFTVFDNNRSIGKLNWAATPKAFEGENGVFATGAGTNPKEMRLYVNMKNPHYPTIDEGMEPAFINEGEDGILGIVDKDMTDFYKSASDAGEGFHMSLGVDNPYALKSANAVTYDKNGVRIPLGKRDNFNIDDIRYGLIPFGIGLTGYGLFNNQEALGGRTKKRKR